MARTKKMKILDHVFQALTAYYEDEPPLTMEEERILQALERPQRDVGAAKSRHGFQRTQAVEQRSLVAVLKR